MNEQTVLFSPLDWGLGHATRLIPLIHAYKSAGANLILAGSGFSGDLIRQAFPEDDFIELPGLEINYGYKNLSLWLSLLKQMPSFRRSITEDQRVINKIVQNTKIDLIISDNRYGVYHKKIKSILITHQLNIQSGLNIPFADRISSSLVQKHFKCFDEIWIPDFPGINNLCGVLAHADFKFKNKFTYLGPLSRFNPDRSCLSNIQKSKAADFKIELEKINNVNKNNSGSILALLSGPEPSRTKFENELISVFKETDLTLHLIRGTKTNGLYSDLPPNIQLMNFADDEKIKRLKQECSLCIMRSGYSSLMDHYYLGGNILLVPTPGQGEQEYLAKYWNEKFNVPYILQSDLKQKLIPFLNENSR